MNKAFLLLQINDALFPIGGYSHSYGLETYIQKNIVNNADTAKEYVRANLHHSFMYTDLLAARLSYEAAEANNIEEINYINSLLLAVKNPREIREASIKLGRRFIKMMSCMPIAYDNSIFNTLILNKTEPICHSVAYGVFLQSIGVSIEEALSNYAYSQASQMVCNLVKTIPLSQTTGQLILLDIHDTLDNILDKVTIASVEELGLSTPAFSIRAMQHEHLYSRLYMS